MLTTGCCYKNLTLDLKTIIIILLNTTKNNQRYRYSIESSLTQKPAIKVPPSLCDTQNEWICRGARC